MKHIIEKRSKWYWLVEVDEEGNKFGIEGFNTIKELRQFAKENNLKISK